MKRSASLVDQLENNTDPRPGEPVYPLVNVLFMMICGVIAGADDFVAIARFANTKKEWSSKFLDMSQGGPSHDRFNAILNAMKPEAFEPILLAWLPDPNGVRASQCCFRSAYGLTPAALRITDPNSPTQSFITSGTGNGGIPGRSKK